MATQGNLERRLGLADAVVIGAGSMIGAGVFAAWAPAAASAGDGLLIGLVLAGVVAFCNAASSAQLAAVHPESGGTYVYGRRQLGPAWGHLAGWGFVVGKTASCAAMALAFGAYVWPEQERLVAIAGVVLIALVNIGGLERTALVTRILLAVSLTTLLVVVVAAWAGDGPSSAMLVASEVDASPAGVLQSAGLLFFAFAGYARIATLGEEVRDPEITIPKAVPRALLFVLAVYLLVGVSLLHVAPAGAIAATDAPLRLVTETVGWDAVGPVVRIGAAIATLGVLLNLVPGVSRTTLAMARRRELPGWFDHVDVRRNLPLRAETTVVVVVGVLVSLLGLRSAIAVSGTAVLTYYAITNASALTLTPEQRRWPRWIAVVGLIGCITLALALPRRELLSGAAVLAVGAAIRRLTAGRTAAAQAGD